MTILEALNQIEDPEIRRRAVEQWDRRFDEAKCIGDAVIDFCWWERTKEGRPFWKKVADILLDDAQPRFADLCHLIPGYVKEPAPEHPAVTLLRNIIEQSHKQPVTITPGNAWGNAINQILKP